MEHRVNAMEQQTYKADAEIYEVLEREIIDPVSYTHLTLPTN